MRKSDIWWRWAQSTSRYAPRGHPQSGWNSTWRRNTRRPWNRYSNKNLESVAKKKKSKNYVCLKFFSANFLFASKVEEFNCKISHLKKRHFSFSRSGFLNGFCENPLLKNPLLPKGACTNHVDKQLLSKSVHIGGGGSKLHKILSTWFVHAPKQELGF